MTRAKLAAAVAVIISIVGNSLMWACLRLPYMDTMIVMTALQSSVPIFAENNWNARMIMALKIIFACGIMQFLIAMFFHYNFMMLLIIGGVTFMCMMILPRRRVSMVMLLVEALSLAAPPGYIPGVFRFIAFFLSGGVVLASIWLSEKIAAPFFPNDAPESKVAPKHVSFPFEQAVRTSFAMMLGFFLGTFFHLQENWFLVMTIGFIYNSDISAKNINMLIKSRAISTPLGLWGSFLFMGLMVFFNYKFIYLVPFIAAASIIYSSITHDYMIGGAVILVGLVLIIDYLNPSSLNVMNLYSARLLNTYIGLLIVYFVENLFFPYKKNVDFF